MAPSWRSKVIKIIVFTLSRSMGTFLYFQIISVKVEYFPKPSIQHWIFKSQHTPEPLDFPFLNSQQSLTHLPAAGDDWLKKKSIMWLEKILVSSKQLPQTLFFFSFPPSLSSLLSPFPSSFSLLLTWELRPVAVLLTMLLPPFPPILFLNQNSLGENTLWSLEQWKSLRAFSFSPLFTYRGGAYFN